MYRHCIPVVVILTLNIRYLLIKLNHDKDIDKSILNNSKLPIHKSSLSSITIKNPVYEL